MKIDTTNMYCLYFPSLWLLKLILCMSSSFIFLPNVKQPKYDDKSWENPLKKLHELDQNANEIPGEFTDQKDKFCVN